MNFYYYIYYLFTKFAKKIGNKNDYPLIGMYMLSTLIFLNVTFLYLVLGNEEARKLLMISEVYSKLTAVGIIILVGIINYFILIKNKKSDKILKYYSDNPVSKRYFRLTTIFIVLYTLTTVISTFYIVIKTGDISYAETHKLLKRQ
jgi:hypothetical protein